jgi:hypothetical protein
MAPAPRNQAAQALEEFQKALQLPTWESLDTAFWDMGFGSWELGVSRLHFLDALSRTLHCPDAGGIDRRRGSRVAIAVRG